MLAVLSFIVRCGDGGNTESNPSFSEIKNKVSPLFGVKGDDEELLHQIP